MQIEIGSLILKSDFFVAYFSGVVILLLFCIERFNEPTNTEGSFVEALVPNKISKGFQYTQTFVIYVGILMVVYSGLSLIGPYFFEAVGIIKPQAGFSGGVPTASDVESAKDSAPIIVPAWVPLAIFLILTGGATHYRTLNKVEFWTRRLTHRLIGIPQNVENLARAIQDRRITLESLTATEQKTLLSIYNQTANEKANSVQQIKDAMAQNDALRRWLRLALLGNFIETKDLPSGFRNIVEQEYRDVWDSIHKSLVSLRSAPKRLQLLTADVTTLSRDDQERRIAVMNEVHQALHDLHALIAVALCPISKDAAKVKAMTDILKLVDAPIEDNTLLNRILLALITLFFGVLVLTFALDSDPLKAFRWATGAFMLHGAAALTGWRFYQVRTREDTFIPMRLRKIQIPTLQYLRVAFYGYLSGTLGLVVWYVLFYIVTNASLPALSVELVWIPAYGTVGILTAFWVTYDLDIVDRQEVALARRVIQVLAQALSTGAVAFFIAICLQFAAKIQSDAAQIFAIQAAITTGIAASILGFVAVFLRQPKEASMAVVTEEAVS